MSFDAGWRRFKTFVSCQHKIHTISFYSHLFTHLKQPLNDKTLIMSMRVWDEEHKKEAVCSKTRCHFNPCNLLEQSASLKGQVANIMMSNKCFATQKIPKVTADTICIKSQTTFTFYLQWGHVCRDPWLVSFQKISNNSNVSEKFNNTQWIVWLGYFHTMTMSHRHHITALTPPHGSRTIETSSAQVHGTASTCPRSWGHMCQNTPYLSFVAVCIIERPCMSVL